MSALREMIGIMQRRLEPIVMMLALVFFEVYPQL